MAIDAEGNCLGRNGTLSTVQIYPENGETVYIVDFTTMGATALAEVEDGVPSFKQVLESPRKKVRASGIVASKLAELNESLNQIVFDVRADANALFFHYGVRLAGVYDLQLLDVAVHYSQCLFLFRLSGLKKCFADYGLQQGDCLAIKSAGQQLFAPSEGGDPSIWDVRPLDPVLLTYAAQDVVSLFDLEGSMRRGLPRGKGKTTWDKRILKESAARVAFAQTKSYRPQGKENALPPNRGWGK